MKPLLAALLGLSLTLTAFGQWRTESYTLHRGWNAIWLPIDLSEVAIDDLGLPEEIVEVWRWNPNDDATTFVEDVNETIELEQVEDWLTWRRGDPLDSNLVFLLGNAAYLLKVDVPTGSTLDWSITGHAVAPSYKWRTDGLNFYGFNLRAEAAVTFSQFFLGTDLINFDTEVYQYPGNDFDGVQPQILGNARNSNVQRLRAYWIRSNQYSTYAGPVSVTAGRGDGLRFSQLSNSSSLQIRNSVALSTPSVVTLDVLPSENYPSHTQAPSNLRPGLVKLARRQVDPQTGFPYPDPLTNDNLSLTLQPGEFVDIVFTVDFDAMNALPGERFESLLRVRDDRGLIEYFLPIVAEAPVRTGLWIGDATITHVANQFTVPSAGEVVSIPEASDEIPPEVPEEPEPGEYEEPTGDDPVEPAVADGGDEGDAPIEGLFPVRRQFNLRLIVHFDESGEPRLISQAYLGLGTESEVVLATTEAPLNPAELGSAVRLTAVHLPPRRAFLGVTDGDIIQFPVEVAYDDPHSPFVHAYHPDHDNLNSEGQPVAAGVESFTVSRLISLIFSDTPPPGALLNWGSTVIGGDYQETITGLHREGMTVAGTFELRRVSDIPTLILP